jgi:hypothetical protein
MEPTVWVVLLLFAVLTGIAWAMHVAGGPPDLRDVFRFPRLGWPSGVQEDDDLHWRWRPSAISAGPTTERVRSRVRAVRDEGRR